jgi:hypothetical protein
VIFDVYYRNSLKYLTREKRGFGTRMHVTANTKIPSNWQEFLRVDENKTELFHFLADSILSDAELEGKIAVMTYDDGVRVCCGDTDTTDVEPCSPEEADARLILHCLHAARCDMKKIAIRMVDTDVAVLAISALENIKASELWIHFGVGKNVRLIAINDICAALGPSRCAALPAFHALTGCDTVSFFYGKGKKSAWSAWDSFPQLTTALLDLIKVINDVDLDTLAVLERFVVVLYDRTCECSDLNAARKYLFTKRSRTLENLPPTSNAFLLHVKRIIYQAVHCWSHCLEKQLPVYDPSHWG